MGNTYREEEGGAKTTGAKKHTQQEQLIYTHFMMNVKQSEWDTQQKSYNIIITHEVNVEQSN